MTANTAPFIRDRANGKLFGVCAGLANRFGIEALWIRLGLVASVLLGFGWVILLYIIAAMIID